MVVEPALWWCSDLDLGNRRAKRERLMREATVVEAWLSFGLVLGLMMVGLLVWV